MDDERAREHAREAIDGRPSRTSTRRSCGSPSALPYVQGDYDDADDLRGGRRGDRRDEQPGLLPRDPAVAVLDGGQRARRRRPDRGRAGRDREAVRPRPRLGPGAQRRALRGPRRGADPADRPLPRQGAGDGHPLPALRQRDAGAGLEPPATSTPCRSRWPRTSASRTAAASTTRSARCATSSRTTCCRCCAGRDGAARPAPTPTRSATRSSTFRAMPTADPRRYVRGQYEGYLDVEGVAPDSTDRDLRRAGARGRQLALERGPVLHPRRQVHAGQGDRGDRGLQAAHRRRSGSCRARPRNRMSDRRASSPSPAPASASSPSRRARRPSSPPTSSCSSKRSSATSPSPTSACSATRSPATAATSPGRTRSRRPGGSSSRCSKTPARSTPTSPAAGGRGGRRPDPRHLPLVRALALVSKRADELLGQARLRVLPAGPARGRRGGARRPGLADRDADRGRQEPLLPAPRAGHRGPDVVVSPLIALMNDQWLRLTAAGTRWR